MKLKILKTMAWRGQHVEPGTIVECTDAESYQFIGAGTAEAVADEPVKKRTNRAVGLEESEPKKTVTKRSTKKKD